MHQPQALHVCALSRACTEVSVVQAMVFGNLGESSGTGVCFTRNPSTGKNDLYGGVDRLS